MGPLSPWERARVRASAVTVQGLADSIAVALTPTLSQGEREQDPQLGDTP
jgi:hypothetical protein